MMGEKEILQAQTDGHCREHLIRRQERTICAWASKAAGRWVDQHDDLYSEALIAFNDAITAYDPSKGGFSAFAARVVSNRVIDQLRKDQRHSDVLPFSALTSQDADGGAIPLEVEDNRTGVPEISWEIQSLAQELEKLGILFSELPLVSPKACKTKAACKAAIRYISRDPLLLEGMRKTGHLPEKQLVTALGISEKVLQRHRKYIIAGVLICAGEYFGLVSYLMGGKDR